LLLFSNGEPVGNIDVGATIGSYLGLFLLAAAFTAIGIFSSSLTQNQIVAFLLAIALCSVFYWGFDLFASFSFLAGKADYFLQQLGMKAHYDAISRGVVDSRDILYFLGISALFLLLTQTVLESRKW
jgi:ABC-2 type transport system permease protein